MTKQCSPRWTTPCSSSSPAIARQKMHSSSFGLRTYSSRQGAHSRASAIRGEVIAVLAALTVLAVPAAASAGIYGTDPLDISVTPGGGAANGDSGAPAVSGDNRKARLAAFQSDASNLVGGDTNGVTD